MTDWFDRAMAIAAALGLFGWCVMFSVVIAHLIR